MKLSEKFPVPHDVALLYDFVNSVDLRRYVEQGVVHDPGDELATPAQLQDWLQARGLLKRGERVSPAEHRKALELRDALRSFLAAAPAERKPTAGLLETRPPASFARQRVAQSGAGSAPGPGRRDQRARPRPGRTRAARGQREAGTGRDLQFRGMSVGVL